VIKSQSPSHSGSWRFVSNYVRQSLKSFWQAFSEISSYH